jgi:SAM-dependent methyltransferase
MSYASLSKKKSANPALLELVATMQCQSCSALDLGAGKLLDARFLLERGFSVDAVDKDPVVANFAEDLHGNEKFKLYSQDIALFEFKKNQYDLVVSFLTLPFLPPSTFKDVFEKILASLRPGGHLCISLFGDKDDWVQSHGERMTFLRKEEVFDLIAPLTTLRLTEEEKDGPTVRGDVKHWHIYTVVARKEN